MNSIAEFGGLFVAVASGAFLMNVFINKAKGTNDMLFINHKLAIENEHNANQ